MADCYAAMKSWVSQTSTPNTTLSPSPPLLLLPNTKLNLCYTFFIYYLTYLTYLIS